MAYPKWYTNLMEKLKGPTKPVELPKGFMTPQVKWLLDHYKWSEHNPAQNKTLAKYIWPLSGFPGWDSILGSIRAWCEAVQNGADVAAGYRGTGRADAISSSKWGRECPPWFGARLHMRHPSGGNHATRFLFWYDESKKLAACLGGNQSDEINITIYNGKSEKFSSFRWAIGQPDGRIVTREEFEKDFPQFKNYKFSGGTR